jgi:UDP-N-acetylmuramoylalanine-D-glutamate ligase
MAFSLQKYQSDYSIFTNFKPDHLNWHRDLQEYFDAKMNLVLHTTHKGVLNQQIIDFVSNEKLDISLPGNVRIFSMNDSGLVDSTNGEIICLSQTDKYALSEGNFSGKHNAMNILSCLMVADEMNIPLSRTLEYLKNIKGLPHRLELISNK